MITFKPRSFSKEDMFSAVEAMSYPYTFSGLKRRELEDFFCEYTKRRYALAVRDLILPLLTLLRYAGVSNGSKVLISPLSFHKHFSPYLRLIGACPLYPDVERWFLNIDTKRLPNVMSEDIKVIIGGNSLGNPMDWDALKELVRGEGILLIEDSRETLFSEYKGKPAGSFGHVSFLEFSESSVLMGYGGIVLTDDRLIYERLKEDSPPLDDIMSSVIFSQIKQLDDTLAIRRDLANLYSRYLLAIEGIKAQYPPKYVTKMCWSYFSVHLGKRYSKDARGLIKNLMYDDGIEVLEYPISQDLLEGKPLEHLHIAHEVSTRALLLPLHQDMEEDDVYFVCERLKEHAVQIGAGSVDH